MYNKKLKIIIIVEKNNKITDNIAKINIKNYDLVCLKDESYIYHYIEEYMPSYVILPSDAKDFENLVEYINNRGNCELIVTGGHRNSKALKKFKNIYVGKLKDVKDLDKILGIIDKMEVEKSSSQKDRYKFVNQQVISFYSVQGGVGKTSIAFNLAWSLKRITGIKVLIIDLNFCEGPSDLSINLNLSLSPNLSLFVENISEGSDALARSVVSLNGFNIDVLQPPLSIYQSDRFSVDMLNNLLYLARNVYNFIIADIPFRYDNTILEMLNLSTSSILVLSPDIGSTMRVNDFQKFLPSDQKKGAIFNKIRNSETKKLKEFKTMLNIPVYENIPFLLEEKRKFIKNGSKFLNFLDLQSNILKLERFII